MAKMAGLSKVMHTFAVPNRRHGNQQQYDVSRLFRMRALCNMGRLSCTDAYPQWQYTLADNNRSWES